MAPRQRRDSGPSSTAWILARAEAAASSALERARHPHQTRRRLKALLRGKLRYGASFAHHPGRPEGHGVPTGRTLPWSPERSRLTELVGSARIRGTTVSSPENRTRRANPYNRTKAPRPCTARRPCSVSAAPADATRGAVLHSSVKMTRRDRAVRRSPGPAPRAGVAVATPQGDSLVTRACIQPATRIARGHRSSRHRTRPDAPHRGSPRFIAAAPR
jgi:hypothetical protein